MVGGHAELAVALTVGVAVAATVETTATGGDAVLVVQPATRPMAMTIGTMTFTVVLRRPARGS